MINLKMDRLLIYTNLKEKLSDFTNEEIEHGVMLYCLSSYGKETELYKSSNSQKIASILKEGQLSTDLETIIEFFESLLDEHKKMETVLYLRLNTLPNILLRTFLQI